jgi:hypothetical protein
VAWAYHELQDPIQTAEALSESRSATELLLPSRYRFHDSEIAAN